MTGFGTTTNVGAHFRFLPRGSQQLVVLAGLVGAIGAVATIAFAFFRVPVAAPATIAAVFTGLAALGWWVSREAADLDGSTPTKITDAASGRSLVTDSRVIANPVRLLEIVKAFESLVHRTPLPQPAGMVRTDGSPDLSRAKEAAAIVDQINGQIQHQTNDFIDAAARLTSSPTVSQPTSAITPGAIIASVNVASRATGGTTGGL